MRLSNSFLVAATVLTVMLLATGCYGFVVNNDRLFFTASIGAMFCCGLVYFGAFMQGLNPAVPPQRGHVRSLREEIDALAKANPERQILRRSYGWLLAMIAITVTLRILALFA